MTDDLHLPNIPIKITRKGDRIKLKCGGYTLELQEIYEGSQTYSLLILDKFLTEVTTIMLKKEIENRINRSTVKSSLNIYDDVATDNVIKQIHEDLFGDK